MLEMNDNAVKSGIAHQNISASTENESWHTALLNELVQAMQILKILGYTQEVKPSRQYDSWSCFRELVFKNVTLNLGAQ